jgi:transposase-like protein
MKGCSGMRDQELESLWRERLASHETSGKSIATWCQEHSFKENQFYYWRKKLRLAQEEKDQALKWISLETAESVQ